MLYQVKHGKTPNKYTVHIINKNNENRILKKCQKGKMLIKRFMKILKIRYSQSYPQYPQAILDWKKQEQSFT